MSTASVNQLRALLSEKFPGLRMRLEEPRAAAHFHPTGIAPLDALLQGGLPQGALTEIVSSGGGSSTLTRLLLQSAAAENRIVAFVDGNDTLDVATLGEQVRSRLLWIRCQTSEAAVKAADLILRDGNLSLVLLDLKANPEKQLRRIQATTWYRFQRLVEESATVCLVITPRPMVAPARARVVLQPQFSLDALEIGADNVLPALNLSVTEQLGLFGDKH